MQDHLCDLLSDVRLDEDGSSELGLDFPRNSGLRWYHVELVRLFEKAGLREKDIHLVYAFCSSFKTRAAIITYIHAMPDDKRKRYGRVIHFFNQFTVENNKDAMRNRKFSFHRIPFTRPGWDILFWAMMTPFSKLKKENVFARPTAVFIKWDPELQELARNGNDLYWADFHHNEKPSKRAKLDLWTEKLYEINARSEFPLLLPGELSPKFKVFGSGAPYSFQDLDEWLGLIKEWRKGQEEKRTETTFPDAVLL